MKGSKFSENQIVRIVKLAENGLPMAECRSQHGISTKTFSR